MKPGEEGSAAWGGGKWSGVADSELELSREWFCMVRGFECFSSGTPTSVRYVLMRQVCVSWSSQTEPWIAVHTVAVWQLMHVTLTMSIAQLVLSWSKVVMMGCYCSQGLDRHNASPVVTHQAVVISEVTKPRGSVRVRRPGGNVTVTNFCHRRRGILPI